MNRNRMTLVVAAALIGTVALVGCRRDEPTTTTTTTTPPPAATTPAPGAPGTTPATTSGVTVTSVDLGTSVGADGRVSSPTTTFGTSDTIYASIATDGNASGNTLGARFTMDGNEVNSDSRTLNTSGPAVTEFHISKPDGWPTGRYQVDVTLDGAVVETRQFEVR